MPGHSVQWLSQHISQALLFVGTTPIQQKKKQTPGFLFDSPININHSKNQMFFLLHGKDGEREEGRGREGRVSSFPLKFFFFVFVLFFSLLS